MSNYPEMGTTTEPPVSYRWAWLVVGVYFGASILIMLFPPVGALFGPSPIKPLFYLLGPLAFAANAHGFVFFFVVSLVMVPLLVVASTKIGNAQAAAVCGVLAIWVLCGMFTCGC